MKVLILFATVEGQTGKIAHFAADQVRRAGHEAVLVDACDRTGDIPLDGIDKAILAASVHERRHPQPFEVFLAAEKRALAGLDTLLLSVSLSAAFPEGQDEARDYLEELEMRTGFTPDAEALVAGALRTASYDYYATQVLRHVVLRERNFDPDAGPHEFTDWDALAATVGAFLSS